MNNESLSDLPITPDKKTSTIPRFLWRIFTLFIVLCVAITAGVIVISYFYQDEVKNYVVNELNKQLNTQIIVDGKDIDFTVIKNFPYASVDFKNVKALEAVSSKRKDTLFRAGKISFQFNIVDIIKKKYDVKKIQIDNVDLNIRIDKNGKDNYHIWKPSADTGTTAFSFALKKIVLQQLNLSYKNKKSNQVVQVLIKKSVTSGQFSNSKYELQTNSELYINEVTANKTTYIRNKNVQVEFALNIDNTIPSYKIKNGKIKIENLLFEVFGTAIAANKDPILNIGIRGKEMDITSVLSLIPNQYKEKINDYKSNGEFYFDAIIQGVVTGDKMPAIKADFGIKNAEITQLKENIILRNVNLKGRYSNGNTETKEASLLELIPFSATIDQGNISGELSLRNLTDPSISAKIKADISLEKLQLFAKIDTVETITGQLKIDASFTGESKALNDGGYENITTSGNLIISDMNVKVKNNTLAFANINGDFTFDNNDLSINSLKGNVSSSDFELKGSFRNCIGFILKDNQDITVEASLNSNNINLDELLANKEEDAPANSKYKLKFSEHINVNLKSEIRHLVFRKFDATAIKGVITLKDKKMTVDPVTLSTMNGNITTSGLIDGSDSTKLLITCFTDINALNVTKLFIAFENFGQSTITDKNIKGLITAKIQFASVYSPELDIDLDKLYAGIDMVIDNGELNKVESFKKLSRFIELKELENIRFATFKNQFEIKDQIITIPKIEIKSNAMDFTTSGTHTFDNEINYKIKLSLNDLLAKKVRKPKQQNDEFGVIEDDGLGRTDIFLSMTGTVDNPIIKYDSKSAVQSIKQDLKVEKQSLKKILKEEFGLFKKDTSLQNTNKTLKEDKTKFTIKWEEEEKKEEKKVLKKPKKAEEDDF
ncbi:MAG: AsmA-like C-terminal region-containing protein [Bacteroidota bacterium]